MYVFGAGGHAKVVIDIAERSGHRITAVVDDDKIGQNFMGYDVIREEDALASSVNEGVIAIGDNWIRKKVADKIQARVPSFRFITLTHPSAQIGRDCAIGDGTVVMAHATVNPATTIGRQCIINTRASLDHDNRIGDFASIAPGVVTGGGCEIGDFAAVSIGSVLIHRVHVGAQTVVGAGSVVVKSLGDGVVAYGAPATVVRSRKPGDKYL